MSKEQKALVTVTPDIVAHCGLDDQRLPRHAIGIPEILREVTDLTSYHCCHATGQRICPHAVSLDFNQRSYCTHNHLYRDD